MDLELFWTGVALIGVWELVGLIRIELVEWIALRKFDKWAEHMEHIQPVKAPTKKAVKKK